MLAIAIDYTPEKGLNETSQVIIRNEDVADIFREAMNCANETRHTPIGFPVTVNINRIDESTVCLSVNTAFVSMDNSGCVTSTIDTSSERDIYWHSFRNCEGLKIRVTSIEEDEGYQVYALRFRDSEARNVRDGNNFEMRYSGISGDTKVYRFSDGALGVEAWYDPNGDDKHPDIDSDFASGDINDVTITAFLCV